jgi:beta-lactamase regulating signal transducer with metallopeptidase domain
MLLPSIIFSIVAALTTWLFVRKNPASDPRLTAAILTLLLVLPLLGFLPKVEIAISSETTSSAAPVFSYLPVFWLGGFLLIGLRLAMDYRSLKCWHRQSRPALDHPHLQEILEEILLPGRVEFRIHPQLNSPVVTGLIQRRIYLPESSASWSRDTTKMAILHELGHLQRGDLWMASLARLTCLLHWFNPAVWWLRRLFHSQCEYACDAHLVRAGADPGIYANALCDVARSSATPPFALAMAGHVPLRDRILVLSRGGRRTSLLLCSLVLLTASSAVALSVVRFSPTASEGFPVPVGEEVELRFTADPFPGD